MSAERFTTPADLSWMEEAYGGPVLLQHLATNEDRRVAACAPIRLDRLPSDEERAAAYPNIPIMLCPGCLLATNQPPPEADRG